MIKFEHLFDGQNRRAGYPQIHQMREQGHTVPLFQHRTQYGPQTVAVRHPVAVCAVQHVGAQLGHTQLGA